MNNNGLLIIPVSSTCFGQIFCPSSGAGCCQPPAGNIVGTLYHKL